MKLKDFAYVIDGNKGLEAGTVVVCRFFADVYELDTDVITPHLFGVYPKPNGISKEQLYEILCKQDLSDLFVGVKVPKISKGGLLDMEINLKDG